MCEQAHWLVVKPWHPLRSGFITFRDLSRKREISEQFVWLNRQYGETEAQLSRSAITPSIRADSSQDEGI